MLEIKRKRLRPASKPANRRKRTARNIFLAIVIILLIIISAGMIYVWYISQQPLPDSAKPVSVPSLQQQRKPLAVDPNALVGIAQQSLSETVVAPGNVGISIKTNPKAACEIAYLINKEAYKDSGLVPKTADEFGIVSWTWTIIKDLPVGKWPVEITCANEKNSAFYRAYLEIKKP